MGIYDDGKSDSLKSVLVCYNKYMTVNDLFFEVYKMYGAVTRARNCFLYTKKGVRLTDLYQEEGRAILGWSGDNAYTQMKNNMNKGISGSFITEGQNRIQKAV